MDSNKKEIRFNQTEYDRIINRHGNAINALQKQIQNIQLNGLTVSNEDLTDMVNHGQKLYEQAEQLARAEAQRVCRIPAAQDAFFLETLTALNSVVSNFKNELRKIFLIDSQFGSLDTGAFEIKNTSVSLSKEWKSRLRDRLTIYETPDREEALRLSNNLKSAIDEVNIWASKNPAFKAGFGISGSGYRTLCAIDNEWGFHINIEELENV